MSFLFVLGTTNELFTFETELKSLYYLKLNSLHYLKVLRAIITFL